jgi:hypothetical protein
VSQSPAAFVVQQVHTAQEKALSGLESVALAETATVTKATTAVTVTATERIPLHTFSPQLLPHSLM